MTRFNQNFPQFNHLAYHEIGDTSYRPQGSCGNVFTGVCHSVHRGVSARHPPVDTPWADTPWVDTPSPWRDTPSTWADTPSTWTDTPLGQRPPGQTPPPPGRRVLQCTVRVLLECIHVLGVHYEPLNSN